MRTTSRPVMSASASRSTDLRRRRSRTIGAAWMALYPLETRVLLSAVVQVAANGKSATYTDIDGDTVTFAVTAGTLNAGDFTTGAPGLLGVQLQVVTLTDPGFAGANITVTDKRGVLGDGVANIGYINASGNDLGTVNILGDLGRIDCGDSTTSTMGLKSLTVRSMGRLSLDSQGGAGSLGSHIIGALGTLTVKGDMQSAFIGAEGGANGTIGAVSIGGSVIGSSSDHGGEIFATGNIGTVKIAGDLQGGGGTEAGAITSTGGNITSVAIGGSIIGSSGDLSGAIQANGNIGSVTVGHDIHGRTGTSSGSIQSLTGNITTVTVAGTLDGSAGALSGSIVAHTNLGTVKIGQSVNGSSGGESGAMQATNGSITSVTIGGSLQGSSGTESGFIFSGLNMGAVAIKHEVNGSDGANSGQINSGGLLTLTVGGSISGGSGDNSGQVFCVDTLTLTVAGNISGSAGTGSGSIIGFNNIKSVTVGGTVSSGSGSGTGVIRADSSLGTVKITGDLRGGLVQALDGTLTSVAIGGSVFGSTTSLSGTIFASSDIGSVAIGGSLVGGSNVGTASVTQTGCIISTNGRVASVTIGGSIEAGAVTSTGALTLSGAIVAQNDIGSVTVKQNVFGNENSSGNTFAVISGRGQAHQGATSDLAIGKVTIGGRVQYANILGGYDSTLTASNADAQIGTVSVGGDWVGSNLVAGAVNTGGPNNFGDSNDALIFPTGDTRNNPNILSLISSVTIKGYVYGTPANVSGSDHFGFVAESVASMTIAGIKLPLTTPPRTDTFVIPGNTGDVRVHEI